jgi:hypothetical protein
MAKEQILVAAKSGTILPFDSPEISRVALCQLAELLERFVFPMQDVEQ